MITFTVINDKAQKYIRHMLAKLSDRRPLMRRIAADIHDAVEQNFAVGGRPGWDDLSDGTKDARRRKGHWPGRILVVSGQLKNSISERSDNDQAVVGTNKYYAAAHQFGFDGTVAIPQHTRRVKSRNVYGREERTSKKTEKKYQARTLVATGVTTVKAHSVDMNIPARPFLKITAGDLEGIERDVIDYIEQKK
ncbi:MAG: phage virion morphogenesis protein [Candidatus Edwardsbacteria bacterium]|nr:phage virion morphogenesis protein [Candidatus Edwardsbacteria bacterium]